jgi:GAF domain-containing protein
MYDQPLFLQALSRFARVLPGGHDLAATLTELTQSVSLVLGLSASEVTLVEDGRLACMTTGSKTAQELACDHETQHPCPARDAFAAGEPVQVSDIREESNRWPECLATTIRLGQAGVAGIPLRLADQVIGSLNLYSTESREWSDEDIAVAGVLADVATSQVANASRLLQQLQLNDQLKRALQSRIVIEQAKGMICHQYAVTIDQAYQLIRAHARSHHASMRVVAEAVVAGFGSALGAPSGRNRRFGRGLTDDHHARSRLDQSAQGLGKTDQ